MFHNDPKINAQFERIDSESSINAAMLRRFAFYGLFNRFQIWVNPREIGAISNCFMHS